MSLDLLVTLLFALAQWRLLVILKRSARARPQSWQKTIRIALWTWEILVAAGYACSFSWLAAALQMPSHLAAYWGAGAVCYLLLSTLGVLLYSVFQPIRVWTSADTNPGRRRVLSLAGNTLMASPFAVIGYGAMAGRTDFQVHEIDLPFPGLSADLDGFRILQLSDIHLGAFLSEAELARVIDTAAELRPHLAVATGDFISNYGDPLEACIRQLTRVKADAGMFGCLGNHEFYARVQQRATDLAAAAGIRILRHQSCQLRFGSTVLNLAGVDHQSSLHKADYLRGAERLVYPGALNILLSHNPDVFPVAARQGYDLMLAGHTHGGQVTVEILDQSINPARFFTPYVRGLYRLGSAAAYVTRGIGTIGIPARIGAPPEISLLRLRKA